MLYQRGLTVLQSSLTKCNGVRSTNFEAALSLLLQFNLQSQAPGRERKSDFGNDCGISFIKDQEPHQRRL